MYSTAMHLDHLQLAKIDSLETMVLSILADVPTALPRLDCMPLYSTLS